MFVADGCFRHLLSLSDVAILNDVSESDCLKTGVFVTFEDGLADF